jgi:hypothetical protein
MWTLCYFDIADYISQRNLQVIGNKVYRAEGRDIKNQKNCNFFRER